MLPAEEQIAIFVANRELWYPVDDYYVPYSYTVCDLDQNGRLELVINICMGTGFFSENYFWEINESLDGVIACDNPFVDYASQVDLGYPETNVYYDAESGVYYYMAEDFIRNGWAFSATEKYAISLEDGQVMDRLLASSATENFEDGSQTVTCTDDAGNEISQEEFDSVEQTVFADLKPMVAKFLWQAEYIEDTDLLEQITSRETAQQLRNAVDTGLTEQERQVIRLRYGLDGKPPRRQREVAKITGISRSYVSRIEKRALEKLRKLLET